MLKKSKTMNTLGWVSTGVFVISLTELLNYARNNKNSNTIPARITLGYFGSVLEAGTFFYIEYQLKKKAILRYNSQFDVQPTPVTLETKVNGNGIGLAIQF